MTDNFDFSEGLDLSFGPDTVEPDEFTPVPANVYRAFVTSATGSMTKGGEGKFKEPMVTLTWVIEDGEFANRQITDRLVIPGMERRVEKPDVWNTMMNMLRDKLEAITGKEWRDDDMKLKLEDFQGAHATIQVGVEHYDYVNGEGVRKVGDSNNIERYLLPDGWDRVKPDPDKTPAQPAPGAAKYEI